MSIAGLIVVFLVVWWLYFFMALPFGATSSHEIGEEVEAGHAQSAPRRPRLWLKAFVATLLAALTVLAIEWVLQSDLIDVRQFLAPREG